MIKIPRISSNADNAEKVRKEMNLILAQIEEQINRDLNNVMDELSEKERE